MSQILNNKPDKRIVDFGVNNDLDVEFSSDEESRLEELYLEKEQLNCKLEEVSRILDPLIQRAGHLNSELSKVKCEICDIKGHRLREDMKYLTRKYGILYICSECGMRIISTDVRDIDVIVDKPKHTHSRIRYKDNFTLRRK